MMMMMMMLMMMMLMMMMLLLLLMMMMMMMNQRRGYIQAYKSILDSVPGEMLDIFDEPLSLAQDGLVSYNKLYCQGRAVQGQESLPSGLWTIASAMEMGKGHVERPDSESASRDFLGSSERTSTVCWGDRFFGQEEYSLPWWFGWKYVDISRGKADPLWTHVAEIQGSTFPFLSCGEPLEVPSTRHHATGCVGVCWSSWWIASSEPCGCGTKAARSHGVSINSTKSTKACLRSSEDAGWHEGACFGCRSCGTFALWMHQIPWPGEPPRGSGVTLIAKSHGAKKGVFFFLMWTYYA